MSFEKTIEESARKGVSSAVKSSSGGMVHSLVRPFALILTKFSWRISITLFLLLFVTAGAVVQAIHQRSVYPLFYEIGGRLISADEMIYQDINTLRLQRQQPLTETKDNGIIASVKSGWQNIMFFLNLISNIWFIYMNFYLFFQIVQFINGKALPAHINFFWTILVLIIIQMVFSLSLFSAHIIKADSLSDVMPNVGGLEEKTDNLIVKSVITNAIPFKGVMSVGVYFYEILLEKTSGDELVLDTFLENPDQ